MTDSPQIPSTAKLDNHLFVAPCHDKRFNDLGDKAKTIVTKRLAAMQAINAAPKKKRAIREMAQRHRGHAGFGEGTLTNLWYEFLRSKDWYCLLNKAVAGKKHWNTTEEGLSEGLIDFVASNWSLRQRDKFRAAYVDLVEQWRLWRTGDSSARLPGYAFCPKADPRTDLPHGWSLENLHRRAKARASRAARKLIQIGPKSAQEFTYKVPTSRYDRELGRAIEPGEFFLFDDCWNDFRCLFNGRGSRILSLHALDLASGCDVLAGHKPTVEDERGVEQRLKECDMIHLGAALLSTIGFRRDGTTFVMEHATATFRTEDCELLERIAPGVFRFDRGPIGSGNGVAGLFSPNKGGNPRHKAPIESFFNLLHNRCDHLLEFPGQTGKNSRLDKPEGLARMEIADEQMHRAMQLLTPERRQQIRFNLLQYEHARPLLDSRIEFCNTRRDHELQGWRECGNYIPAFRLGHQMPWLPFHLIDRLAPEAQEQLRVMLAADPLLCGEICMNPREVFERGRAPLQKLTPPQTALFLAQAAGDELSVKRGVIEVECPEVDPCNKLAFGPCVRDCQGREDVLRTDEKYLVRVSRFMPGTAFLYNAKGGFQWIAKNRWDAGSRSNEAAAQRHFIAKSQQVAPILAEAKKLAAPITERASGIISGNAQQFHEQHLEETATERRLTRRANNSDGANDFTALDGAMVAQAESAGPTMEELSQL